VIAAIEPYTQNGFVANRIVDSVSTEARVLKRPELKMSPVP
jgi:hypothetical protein